MKRNLIVEIVSGLYALIFIYAAVVKGFDMDTFSSQMSQSPMLIKFVPYLRWTIPIIEVIIAIMLLVPRVRLAGLYLAFSLMCMFTFYIIAILQFAGHVPCSCGGIISKMTWSQHLIFNFVLDFLAIWAVIIYPSKADNIFSSKSIAI